MISYDAMVTEITSRLGNRADIGNRIGRWINYAYLEILKNPRFDFRELDASVLFSTQAAVSAYNIASITTNFWFLLDLRDNTNNRKFSKTHWQVIDRIEQTSGQPVRYYLFNSMINLDPIPDNVYDLQLRYRRNPELLGSGATFDLLGDEWEEPIIVISTIKGAQGLGLAEVAAAQRQLLEPMLASRYDRPALEDMDSETTISPGDPAMSMVPYLPY